MGNQKGTGIETKAIPALPGLCTFANDKEATSVNLRHCVLPFQRHANFLSLSPSPAPPRALNPAGFNANDLQREKEVYVYFSFKGPRWVLSVGQAGSCYQMGMQMTPSKDLEENSSVSKLTDICLDISLAHFPFPAQTTGAPQPTTSQNSAPFLFGGAVAGAQPRHPQILQQRESHW